MKTHFIKYITAVLFISLFFFKGLVAVCPGLFASNDNDSAIEKTFSTQTEGEKKSIEDRCEQEAKDIYLGNDCSFGMEAINFFAAAPTLQDPGCRSQQSVHISIPTPPPEKL